MSGPTPDRPRTARWLPMAPAAALLLVLAACSTGASTTPSEATESSSASKSEAAAPSESEAAEESYEITVTDTAAGSALAGEGGMTLYTFDNDSNGQSACASGCVENWPPFTVDEGEEATAGEGVTGDIGSITRDDGTTQVTYNSAPLYYFSGDSAPGDSNGDGVGEVWHIAVP